MCDIALNLPMFADTSHFENVSVKNFAKLRFSCETSKIWGFCGNQTFVTKVCVCRGNLTSIKCLGLLMIKCKHIVLKIIQVLLLGILANISLILIVVFVELIGLIS